MESLPNPKLRFKWNCPAHVTLSDNFEVDWKCTAEVNAGHAYFDCQELDPKVGYKFCQEMFSSQNSMNHKADRPDKKDGRGSKGDKRDDRKEDKKERHAKEGKRDETKDDKPNGKKDDKNTGKKDTKEEKKDAKKDAKKEKKKDKHLDGRLPDMQDKQGKIGKGDQRDELVAEPEKQETTPSSSEQDIPAAAPAPLTRATRFFVVKSDESNMEASCSCLKALWAVSNEAQKTLNVAFGEGRVILMFSPSGTGKLKGFMKMLSLPGIEASLSWKSPQDLGEFFAVEWYCVADVTPEHTNPWNHDRPVAACGELQELPDDLGNVLCQYMWENGEAVRAGSIGQAGEDGNRSHADAAPNPTASSAEDATTNGGEDPAAAAVPSESSPGLDARYFVIKAPEDNVLISQKRGVWATHKRSQPALLNARQDRDVILLFSALGTDKFQGFAVMQSVPDPQFQAPWKCSKRIAQSLGDCFQIQWEAFCNVKSAETNSWNSDKPVWRSRDCQAVAPEVGARLCALMKDAAAHPS